MKDDKLGPYPLEGGHVVLEPLRMHHSNALLEAAKDSDWTWTLSPLQTKEHVEQRIQNTLDIEKKDEGYAFAVFLRKTRRLIGSTSYFGVVSKHKRAEIGYTWYTRDNWATFVNPECKYLLLKHAFEDWHAIRIQLRTDVNNVHSQRAIQKLGAQYEGTLRNDGIRPDGSVRDSKLYSIIPSEWPIVKPRLLARIN